MLLLAWGRRAPTARRQVTGAARRSEFEPIQLDMCNRRPRRHRLEELQHRGRERTSSTAGAELVT